jgi:hypothetical protein
LSKCQVASKATRFSHDLLTENAVLQDNSTGKVAEAFEQIYETARRIVKGDLDTLLADKAKPLIGVVVTHGELHGVNSPFYFEAFTSKRLEKGISQDWPGCLTHTPQIMKIDTLENFLVVMRETGLSPLELIKTKLSQPYERTGDWPQYMQVYSSKVRDRGIPVLRSAADEFFRGALGDRWPIGES